MKLANNLTLNNILASIKSSYTQKFSKQRIKELIDGYKEGIEIRAYADPRIPDHFMYPIRQALLDFGNPSDYELLIRYKGFSRLDKWAIDMIYDGAPYYVKQ